MKKIIMCIFLLSFSFTQDVIYGYLKSSEVSFCMDECGRYYIESEFSDDSMPPQVFILLNDEKEELGHQALVSSSQTLAKEIKKNKKKKNGDKK